MAMAYLESAVVVYLRHILYPEGFEFPLKPISHSLVVTELWREAATILMLIGAGIMAGRKALDRFAYFLYCFAIWDIFYYVFLKVLLNWPASFFTWDVLFLIPITWTGPVLTPILISLLMILLALELIYLIHHNAHFKLIFREYFFVVSGALVVIVSFCWDYASYMTREHDFSRAWSLTQEDLFDASIRYIPQDFNYPIYFIGIILILISMYSMYRRHQTA